MLALINLADLRIALLHPDDLVAKKVIEEVAHTFNDHAEDAIYLQAFFSGGGQQLIEQTILALRNSSNTPILNQSSAKITGLFGFGINSAANLQSQGKLTSLDLGKWKDLWSFSAMLDNTDISADQWNQSVVDHAAHLSQCITTSNANGNQVGGLTFDLPKNPAILKRIYDDDSAKHLSPLYYKTLLQQFWICTAAKNAGIDLNNWDPQLGVQANQDNIRNVYTFYSKLFLSHPASLQWAGMANMVGPSFAAGFLDLDLMKEFASTLSAKIGSLPSPVRYLLSDIGNYINASAKEFSWIANKFLEMQKHIFFDQAAMHEAYLNKGIDGIKEMYTAGLFDPTPEQGPYVPNTALATLQAWQDIDSGDPVRIKAGNAALLFREQMVIIRKQYNDMYKHNKKITRDFTSLMTMVSAVSIPGTRIPFEYKRRYFNFEDIGVVVKTSLPSFNITNAAARWDYISNDILPAYQKLLDQHQALAQKIISTPVEDRIKQLRILNRVQQLAIKFISHWDIGIGKDKNSNIILHDQLSLQLSKYIETRKKEGDYSGAKKIFGHQFKSPVTIFGNTFNFSKVNKLKAAAALQQVLHGEADQRVLYPYSAELHNGRLGKLYKAVIKLLAINENPMNELQTKSNP